MENKIETVLETITLNAVISMSSILDVYSTQEIKQLYNEKYRYRKRSVDGVIKLAIQHNLKKRLPKEEFKAL